MELVGLTFLLLALGVSALGTTLFVGFIVGMWYSRHYYDGSEDTGAREWSAFRAWLVSLLRISAKYYFDYEVRYANKAVEERVRRYLPPQPVTNNVSSEEDEKEEAESRHDTPLTINTPQTALFCGHPHGLLAVSSLYMLTMQNSPWLALRPCIHKHVFATPLLRDLALWFGARDVTRANIETLLHKETCSVYIAPGGCREMITLGSESIQTQHTGFLRIAYRLKRPVFPVIHRGQENVFRGYTWPWLDTVRHIMLDITGYPLPSFFLGPFPGKLTSWVYAPLEPSDYASVDQFIEAYYTTVKAYASSGDDCQ